MRLGQVIREGCFVPCDTCPIKLGRNRNRREVKGVGKISSRRRDPSLRVGCQRLGRALSRTLRGPACTGTNRTHGD